jgi:hypothetical protein
MSKTIEISTERYVELCVAEEILSRLNAAGVDNWEGREYAFSDDISDESIEDFEERITKEVENI